MKAGSRVKALKWPRRFAEYSPAELARISGLSAVMQRGWRHNGVLPKLENNERVRYSPAQAVEISIRYALSKHGMPPARTRTIDPRAISGALYHALLGHHGSCEVIGPPSDVDALLLDRTWPDLVEVISGSVGSNNYLLLDDEGGVRTVDDPQKVFDGRTVSIVAIDLAVIGARLMERGRKPIIAIEAPEKPGVQRIRRLNGVATSPSGSR